MNSTAPMQMALSATLNAGKWPAAGMKIEEVDHMAVQHAVDHVADGAAQDQRQRPAEQALAGMALQQIQDEDDGADARSR